jgi:hypothetical protein
MDYAYVIFDDSDSEYYGFDTCENPFHTKSLHKAKFFTDVKTADFWNRCYHLNGIILMISLDVCEAM